MLKKVIDPEVKLPFYAKSSLMLIGLFVLLTMLCIGKAIIIPLLFSLVFSILFSGIVDFLVKRKMNRLLAIIITVASAVFCWPFGSPRKPIF